MNESWAERLRRRVDEVGPNTPQDELGAPVLIWLADLPFRLREAIFLLMEGYERQQNRSQHKGQQTRQERRARREMSK